MDEDQILQSIIADPKLTDPSIDVGKLRQTTPTRAELLADVPEFSGLKFDPTQRSYVEDLYALYGGGAPMVPEPAVQTPVVTTPIVDTSAMDQPASDSVLDATPTDSGLTESGTFAGQPTFTTTPGTTVDNVTGDITNPDGSYGGNIVDEVALTGGTTTPVDTSIAIEDLTQPSNVGDFQVTAAPTLTNQTQITDPVTPIQDLPMVTTSVNPATGEVFDAQTGQEIGNLYDEVALTGTGTPEQQEGFLQNVLGRAGQTVDNALNELGKVPGAVVDFAKQTVDVFGRKLNVGKTLASAVINKLAGGPISLVFDVVGALASNLPPGISETTNKAREVGLLVGDSTVTQDKYGINTQSAFGDYNQYNLDRVEVLENKTNKTPRDVQELEERKNYIEKTGAAGDITPDATPTDIATGNVTGDATVAETIAQNQNIVDEVALTGGDDFDVTNEAAVNVGTPSFEGFDSGGFDPAPAPAPAPTTPSAPPSQGFDGGGGRDRDRGNGGGGGSSSGGGGESRYGGFCFDPNTPIQMADGSEKKIKEVQLGDQTKGGEVTGVFQFKASDEIHDYKGVTVAGSHYVKEDGKFIMVQDSPISVKINKIPVVYSLDTTGRRIFIKDIEFADYNGDGIAKGFLANAGVNISGFNEEVLRQVENRLI